MKRFLSFCLAVVMIFSCLPVFSVQATAEDPVLPAQTQPIEVPDPTTETVPEEPLPEETIPGETSPEEAVPEEVPAETAVPTEPPTETTEPVGGNVPAQVISAEWTAPYKYEYIINQEQLDTTGCTLTLIYDDGSQKVYNISPKMVSGFDNTVLGTQTLVATCQGYKLYFDIVVKMLEPQSMFFREWEVKRAYFLGEDLDLTGGTLQVYYSDGSVVMVPVEDPGVAVSGYDPNLLGEQFLTISYQGLTTEFRVTVCSYTGKCGDNLDYVFDEATGALTITGSGAMYDYDYNGAPWTAYAEQIRTVELPETLTALGKSAFWCCYNLNSINLPDGITSIPDGALDGCRALTSLEIPDSVTHIGHYAFSGAGLTGLDLPEGLESIGNYAFMSCGSLREIVLPESLKSLGGGAFYNCSNLETANIPETLDTISWYTFIECTSLKEITIPKSVTEISYWAFESCTALKNVVFEGSAPSVDAGLFGDCYPFDNVTSDAWYPDGDITWTQSAMQSMGGNLTWNALPASASILRFHDELAGEVNTLAVSDGVMIQYAPVTPENSYYTFLGWFSGRDGKGEQLIPGETVWYEGMPLDYYACYMENDLDAFRNLSVYIRYYVNGIQKNTVMYTMEYMQPENMYRWLSDNTDAIRAAIPELAGSDAYVWDGKYYDYDTDELITSADLTDGDDKRIYVKAFANNVAEADVMLYVHRDIETDVSGIYAMPGYIVGESVRMHEVRAVIDANYAGSYTDIQGMYTEDAWTELLNGTDNGGVGSIRISDDSITKIHVILKKALQNGICGDDLTWVFDEDSGTLSISGSGAMYDYDWEGAPWKPYAARILKVKLPDTLTALGAFAFDGCVNLTELNLPEGIPAIPKGALNNCESLTSLTIPDSVKTIGDTALSGCHGLTELILPDSVETIENFAFSWSTGLNSVVLPKSLKTLSDGAFEGCTNLENVNIPESISIINWNTFGNCTNLKTVTIPKSVTEIVYAAFGGAGLETVTFKGSAPYVAPHVFMPFDGVTADAWYPGGDATWTKDAMQSMGGNLTWKEIGGSVEPVNPELPVTATVKLRVNIRKEPSTLSVKIGMLEAGTQVTIYEIKTVDDLEWARIDQGWVVMQYLEISDSEEVTSGTCGDNLTWEFDKNTRTLTISGSGAMYDYAPGEDNAAPWYHLRKDIKNLVLSDDITTIGDCAFWGGAGMRTVHIPEGVVSIGNFAFDICEDLVEITLPETLTHIGEYAFDYCISLKNITIPSGITVIEYGTFYLCQSLEEVVFCGDAPEFKWHNQNGNEENVFSGVTATVYYPASNPTWTPPVMQDYGGNITWRPYGEAATSGICGDNLTWEFDKDTGALVISGYGAMYDFNWETRPWNTFKEQILTVELPEELTSLGEYAFGGCHNLTRINLPDGITSIPDYAFGECSTLSGLVIPDSVKHIGEYALDSCRSLTSLVIPDSVEAMDFGAFYGCSGLKEITLPNTLKELGACAFKYCSSLESVKLSESLSIIHYNTFLDCTSLKEINIPKSVTEIAYRSFMNCVNLETITFEGSAPQPAYGYDDPQDAPFRNLTSDAWYPAADMSWTDEAMQKLGSDLRWIPMGDVENCIIVDAAELDGVDTVWVDGVEYPVSYRSGSGVIQLPDGRAKTMVTHTYHVDDPNDIHTQYPVSMKVWTLENEDGIYTATRQEAFDDILQYSGISIRVYGRKGIRMITSMDQSKKNALTGGGLAGYKLKEYGTAVAWADQLSDSRPLILGKSYVKSNYAYKRGVADPVFQHTGNLMQYTNVLVNFSNEQCRNDIAMRPYMILENAQGETVTVYGGIVYRSIGYIAYQNRNTFEPGTEEYEYVWEIIHYVYGSLYDDEYIIAWTPPIM